MGLFEGMLKDSETLFKNEVALDFSFQPKLIPYREKEQFTIASCIKPLFANRDGRHVLVHGKPGIGKTVACKHVLREIEEETDEIEPIYINCWQKNTTYKVVIEICEQLDYKFTQNKKTEDLLKIVKNMLNKKAAVIVFDEIDKAEEFDFLYTILEEIYRKSIVLISNYKEWVINLDQRIKSRLAPSLLEFKPYTPQETKGILEQRKDYAFHEGVWTDEAFQCIAEKASEHADIRVGLNLMREAGNEAENRSSRKIELQDVEQAVGKLEVLGTKNEAELTNEEQFVLDIVKLNKEKKIGDLFKLYQENGGKLVYKSFQRNIKKLADGKFITAKKISGGTEGSTTIVSFNSVKKLDEF